MLDTNDMRSPTISRTNEIKYKMVRSSKHAKRSKMKKTKLLWILFVDEFENVMILMKIMNLIWINVKN